MQLLFQESSSIFYNRLNLSSHAITVTVISFGFDLQKILKLHKKYEKTADMFVHYSY